MQPQQVGIIGHGRFGRFWASLLRANHTVWINDVQIGDNPYPHYLPLEDLCRKADVLFLCVPIGRFEEALEEVRKYLQPGTVVFDTCSVKMYPAEMMRRRLGEVNDLTLIASHPMFGPDSARNGVDGLPMVNWLLAGDKDIYEQWAQYFKTLGLDVVEVSPEAHDRLAAYSQGVTHYIGRVLEQLNLQPTPIDTQGFGILLSLIEQTCNDSWELFQDLQIHNPYTREMRLELESALDEVYAALLPDRVADGVTVVGVQGGDGSFSEEAGRALVRMQPDDFGDFQIKHLYTTSNVLEALHRGEIDYGVFAIQNAAGGVVMESIHALSSTNCKILNLFDLVINHSIMHHPEAKFENIDTLISHPQALAQCAQKIKKRYPNLKLASGEGDMIDQALCARELAAGNLPKTTAVLASSVCAEKFGLVIYDTGLQDLGDANLTTFAWSTRKPRNSSAQK